MPLSAPLETLAPPLPPPALTGRCIVCFAGEDWWFHNPHSNLHLMQAFARHNRVLFVNSIGMRPPALGSGLTLRRLMSKARSMRRSLREALPSLHVLSPKALPAGRGRWGALADGVNSAWLARQTAGAMRSLNFERPLIWISLPSAAGAALRLRRAHGGNLVYYCVDNIAHLPGADRERVLAQEASLLETADCGFFVNRTLLREKRSRAPLTFLSHGVDYEHFAADGPQAEDLRGLRRPIAGYMGQLRELDCGLIRYLAARNPGVNFVFIGEPAMNLEPLRHLPNVRFLGKRSYADLPAYVRGFDVCCLFYQSRDPFNAYRNPKKLLEYLAAGKPVVSVDLIELRASGAPVSIARGPEEFHAKLNAALADTEGAERRRAYASRFTWDAVAAQAGACITAAIGATQHERRE